MATITKPMALDESFNTTESTPRSQADVLVGIEQAIVRGFGQVANAVSYDNTDSGLTADNVQDAIDEVDDTVDGLVDDVAEISSDIESTQTISGNPLTLTDAAPINAESLVVELEPKQEGSGDPSPTNIRPITGYTECEVESVGKNLWGGIKFAQDIKDKKSDSVLDTANKTIEPSGYEPYVHLYSNFKANTQYTFILRASTAASSKGTNFRVVYTDNTFNDLFLDATTNGKLVYVSTSGKTISYISTIGQDTPPKLLYDECGLFEGVITLDEFVPYHSSNATIQFGQTVYGGSVDFLTGKLIADTAYITVGDLSWNYDSTTYGLGLLYSGMSNLLLGADGGSITCSSYKYVTYDAVEVLNNGEIWNKYYAFNPHNIVIRDTRYNNATDFVNENSNVQICYTLVTPIEIQLTPQELKLLKQYNNLTTNGTTINLGYQPDNVIGEVKGEIEKCSPNPEFMHFEVNDNVVDAIPIIFDEAIHSYTVSGDNWKDKTFLCVECCDMRYGILQLVLSSDMAFVDSCGKALMLYPYMRSIEQYIKITISLGQSYGYEISYQTTSTSSLLDYLKIRVRLFN